MAVPAEAPIRQHITVLLHEAVDALLHRPDGTYIDGTFGRGGHSRLILSRLAPGGRLMAIDRDPQAIAHAREGDARIDDDCDSEKRRDRDDRFRACGDNAAA